MRAVKLGTEPVETPMRTARRPLAAALLAAFALPAAAGTAVTVYSSAQPGTLSPQTFRSGGEGLAIPGYALVREDRRFDLKAGRNLLRVPDVPALIDPTTVSFASLTDPKGTRVVEQSFEFEWIAPRDTRVVTIPVGYGDGYSRRLSNTGEVLIGGKLYPIIGRVNMDQIMVDIGDSSAFNGDEVVLIGTQERETISVDEIASKVGTISWEILTSINTRVPRIFK